MPIPAETVALPLVKGLDVQTDARLVPAPALLEAENTQFSGGGAKKRRGHTSLLVRTEDRIWNNYTIISGGGGGTTFAPGILFDTWQYGMGYGPVLRESGQEDTDYWTINNPEITKLSGVTSRDNETFLWDSFRALSYTPSQLTAQAPFASEVQGQATMPTLHAVPLGKVNERQAYPEFADNGSTKILTWINASNQAKYAIYDSESDALISSGTFAVTVADYSRAFTLGAWMHVAVRDNDDDTVKLFSINSQEPNDVTFRSYGAANYFDIWKVSDTEALLARSHAGGVDVTWISTVGSGSVSRTHFGFVPSINASWAQVAIALGVGDELAVAWSGVDGVAVRVMTLTGALMYQGVLSGSASGLQRLTLSSKYSQTIADTHHDIWDVFWDNGTDLKRQRVWAGGAEGSLFLEDGVEKTRYRMRLASRAWRVGDRTFVWVGHNSTLQSTWFLLDEGLLPVGKMDFGVADVGGLGTARLHGINFSGTDGYTGSTANFHLSLAYKLRVAPDNSAQALAGIYTEPTPKSVYLDFYPRLRAAQAGRTTYFAGAQLWAYDGREVVEAGFHTGPEPTTSLSAGGTLTNPGTYSYRVDLCHRNAQNEEVRSLSILTAGVETTGTDKTITLTIPTVLTRRSDSYFLIYRNAMSSGVPLVNWWLLNSRDPNDASYRKNDLSLSTVSFVDNGAVSDTVIQTRELHPATDTYLQPISAPACEIVAAGRDRVWVAGGELPPGKVAPSRLFDPGEAPSFNAYLEFQVDRSNEPVTAMGFIGEVGVFFRPNSTYLIDSDGPDNIAQGFWNPPRLALADVGAVSQDSVARITQGLVFQSPAGIRLLGPGGALNPVGVEVDRALKDFEVVGTLVSEGDQEVRFYGTDTTYVLNYLYGTWARWTCGGIGVAKDNSGLGIIARSDGRLWIETDGIYKDGPTPYRHRIRTSWLHGGNLGDFQRVRRIGGLGRYSDPSVPSHNLRLEIYYDERDHWEERIDWTLPDTTTNQDTWGAGNWGDGVWGDTSATIANLEDLTWEWERDPSRQKCSVFSVALEDVNTDGPGFVLSAFTLELARKQGLNRTPERTGTGTHR